MTTEAGQKYGVFNCPNCGAAADTESVSCPYCHSSLATRVCAACFGAVSVGMKHCPWCGAGEIGAPVSSVNRKCPRCTQRLSQLDIAHHAVFECIRCGGLWVDRSTFQEICTRQEEQEAVLGLSGRADQPSDPALAGRDRVYVPCPECGKLMNRQNFAGCSRIIVDWCREHGTWFDRNELRQIVTFIQDGGLKKAREREKRKIDDEKARLREHQLGLSPRLSPMADVAVLAAGVKTDGNALLAALASVWRDLES